MRIGCSPVDVVEIRMGCSPFDVVEIRMGCSPVGVVEIRMGCSPDDVVEIRMGCSPDDVVETIDSEDVEIETGCSFVIEVTAVLVLDIDCSEDAVSEPPWVVVSVSVVGSIDEVTVLTDDTVETTCGVIVATDDIDGDSEEVDDDRFESIVGFVDEVNAMVDVSVDISLDIDCSVEADGAFEDSDVEEPSGD